MPDRGLHDEVLAEIFIDRFRLGGRFYDYEILGHCCSFRSRTDEVSMTEGCFYLECRRFLRAAKKIALKLSQKPSEQFSALYSCVFTAKFFMFGLLPESPRIPAPTNRSLRG